MPEASESHFWFAHKTGSGFPWCPRHPQCVKAIGARFANIRDCNWVFCSDPSKAMVTQGAMEPKEMHLTKIQLSHDLCCSGLGCRALLFMTTEDTYISVMQWGCGNDGLHYQILNSMSGHMALHRGPQVAVVNICFSQGASSTCLVPVGFSDSHLATDMLLAPW